MLQLNLSPFPILESERLRFRKLTNEDSPEILALRGNPETMKFIPRPLVVDIEGALAHIKMINDKINDNLDINWAVTEKESIFAADSFFNLPTIGNKIGEVLFQNTSSTVQM